MGVRTKAGKRRCGPAGGLFDIRGNVTDTNSPFRIPLVERRRTMGDPVIDRLACERGGDFDRLRLAHTSWPLQPS